MCWENTSSAISRHATPQNHNSPYPSTNSSLKVFDLRFVLVAQGLLPARFAPSDCKPSPYSALFVRAPRQYKTNPTKTDATVPPTNFNSNPNLSAESPGGTKEAAIATSTTTNPN